MGEYIIKKVLDEEEELVICFENFKKHQKSKMLFLQKCLSL